MEIYSILTADNVTLLASRFAHMQEKSSKLHSFASYLGLQINTKKTKRRFNSKTGTRLRSIVTPWKMSTGYLP